MSASGGGLKTSARRRPPLTHHRAAQQNYTHRLDETRNTHDPGEPNKEENAENILETR